MLTNLVKADAMKAPSVKADAMKAPSVKAPSVKAPSVKTPSVKTPSVCFFLHAGLGNRLFQLATAFALSKKNDAELKLISLKDNTHSTSNYFDSIFKKYKHNLVNTFDVSKLYQESKENCCVFVNLSVEDGQAYKGFFQCEKYFIDCRKDFIATLTFPLIDREKYWELNNSFFIHIRGGDYLRSKIHFLNLKNYYKKAIDYCLKKYQKANFYLFTDDLNYVKRLNLNIPLTYIEENETMSLAVMKECRLGGICANSTFSWWGGWLNENPEKILIFPTPWLNTEWKFDVYPKGSVIIEI